MTDWPERFNNIGVVKNPGINLTPFEYDEWGNYSILLSDQYYTDDYEYLVATYGKYQAGFIGFRNNEDSLECSSVGRAIVLNGAMTRTTTDAGPTRSIRMTVRRDSIMLYDQFTIYRFNTEQKAVVEKKGNELYIDGIKLIMYHYYGFKRYKDRKYDLLFFNSTAAYQNITLIEYHGLSRSYCLLVLLKYNSYLAVFEWSYNCIRFPGTVSDFCLYL